MPPRMRKAKEFLTDWASAVIRIKNYDCTRIADAGGVTDTDAEAGIKARYPQLV